MRLYNVARRANRVLFQEVTQSTAEKILGESNPIEIISVPTIAPKFMDPVLTWYALPNRKDIKKAAWRSHYGEFYLSLCVCKGKTLADYENGYELK